MWNVPEGDEICTMVGSNERPSWVFVALDVWSRLWSATVAGKCSYRNTLKCPPVHPETPLFAPPLIVSRLRLTAAARRKNSSPENLTHLHYNLFGNFGKDSSRLM